MWFLLPLMLINAAASHTAVILEKRLMVGGFPVNLLDAAIAFALLAAVPALARKENPVSRAVPGRYLVPLLIVFAFGAAGGALGSLGNGASIRELVTPLRNFLSLPACVLIGYALLGRPGEYHRFLQFQIGAGVAATVLILREFFSRASDLRVDSTMEIGVNLNYLRILDFVNDYAGIAALLLFFAASAFRQQKHRWLLLLLLGGFCALGLFAPLHRSSWVAFAAGFAATLWLICRKAEVRGAALGAVFAVVVLALSVNVGLRVASAASGRDFRSIIAERIHTLLPKEDPGRAKAWESRVPAIMEEVRLWLDDPILGKGFGVSNVESIRIGVASAEATAFRHNAWTSTLAETGTVGFIAMAMLMATSWLSGRRILKHAIGRDAKLIGILAMITPVYFAVLGATTQSFNIQRPAICLGIIVGVAIRAARHEEIAALTAEVERLTDDNAAAGEALPQPEVSCA